MHHRVLTTAAMTGSECHMLSCRGIEGLSTCKAKGRHTRGVLGVVWSPGCCVWGFRRHTCVTELVDTEAPDRRLLQDECNILHTSLRQVRRSACVHCHTLWLCTPFFGVIFGARRAGGVKVFKVWISGDDIPKASSKPRGFAVLVAGEVGKGGAGGGGHAGNDLPVGFWPTGTVYNSLGDLLPWAV